MALAAATTLAVSCFRLALSFSAITNSAI